MVNQARKDRNFMYKHFYAMITTKANQRRARYSKRIVNMTSRNFIERIGEDPIHKLRLVGASKAVKATLLIERAVKNDIHSFILKCLLATCTACYECETQATRMQV